MPASNIKSVELKGDNVIVIGELDRVNYDPTLLHVWLVQPGAPPIGAGLAIDCLGGPHCKFDKNDFTLTAAPSDFVGKFVVGPVTASAIAVLTPKPSSGVAPEFLQWQSILTVSEPSASQA
jgi:hypothetical protein